MNAFVGFGPSSVLRWVMWSFAVSVVFGLGFQSLILVVETPVTVLGPNTKTYLTLVLGVAGYYLVRALITVVRPPLDHWYGWAFLRAVAAVANAGAAFHLAGL